MITRNALFCTVFSAFSWYALCPYCPYGVYHTDPSYVSYSTTTSRYSCCSSLNLTPHVDPDILASAVRLREAFVLISVSCFFHASFVSRCTPKYRLLSDGFTNTPPGNSNRHLVLNCLGHLVKCSNSYFLGQILKRVFWPSPRTSSTMPVASCSFLQLLCCVLKYLHHQYTPLI